MATDMVGKWQFSVDDNVKASNRMKQMNLWTSWIPTNIDFSELIPCAEKVKCVLSEFNFSLLEDIHETNPKFVLIGHKGASSQMCEM